MAKKSTSNSTYSIDHTAEFLPGASIIIVDDDQPAVNPTSPVDRKQLYLDKIVQWGPHNCYPQEVIAKANKSPELLALIQFVVYFMYGDGLTYEIFDPAHTGGGRPKYVEGYDEEVEKWMAENNLSDYLLESIIDMVWFNHGFTELIKNKKRTKIVQIAHQEAAFCRFGKQNEKGVNDKVFINANWGQSGYDDEYTSEVPCINLKDRNKLDTVLKSAFYKFMYATSFPGPGNLVYQPANWHALFPSGYYDVSILVPILKRALMQFTMTVKYMIKVPQAFWVKLAKDKDKIWEDLDYNEKKALRKELNKEMNDFLTGAENAGKSFVSTFGWDERTQTEIPGITIVAIDDKMKDGVWIADSQEASAQFIRALNLVPAIVGHLTGKGMGAGSGSDVRVHGNAQNKQMASRRDKVLGPLNFVAQFNKWTERLKGFRWKIKDFQFDTLDVNHSTTNESTNNVESDQLQRAA